MEGSSSAGVPPVPERDERVGVRGDGTGWQRPDWLLALAFGSLAMIPTTRGASLVLAPVAWALAARERRRCAALKVEPTERVQYAHGVARFVSLAMAFVVAAPLVILAIHWLAVRLF